MSIASALFTDSQARVYRWLFGQPERSYHWNEMRRLTGLGSASLQRELNRLVDGGMVQAHRVGNLRCFQADAKSAVYPELVSLTRKTLGVAPVVRQALRALGSDLQVAWLFGSVAKQTDTAQSDIDLMLVGEKLSLGRVLELLTPLEPQLGRKINPVCYTAAEFAQRRGEPDSFVNRVLEQATQDLMEQVP